MKIVTAKLMQDLDRRAIEEYGIPGLILMENAGRGAVEALTRHFGDLAGKIVSIFVGPGNNGGDGLVIARHLHQQGSNPELYLLAEEEKIKGDAATNLRIVRRLPIPLYSLRNSDEMAKALPRLKDSWLIIDSIFGTGLTRKVSGHYADVIRSVNQLVCPVMAVDIPSGLCADTGLKLGECVRADLTVTFGLAKTGQVCSPGRDYVGRLEVIDISIPPETVAEAGIQVELLDTATVRGYLPTRPLGAHKGTYGHLLIAAGSTGKTGAAILCARGGLRSGTGLVSLCVPHDLNHVFETALWEAMTIPFPSGASCLSIDDYEKLQMAAAGKQAIAVGPGIGMAEKTGSLLLKLYREAQLPMVVDADALNILAQRPEMIKNPPAPRILTPHPGEMARLTGLSTSEIQQNRLRLAQEFATKNQVIVILKGAGTVIADLDGKAAINSTGNPGMAAGGMGDVLTGIIGGLLAQKISPWQAACLGVYVHGLAGDRLAGRTDSAGFGYLASELADEIPATFCSIHPDMPESLR